jgi:hypothetical protein
VKDADLKCFSLELITIAEAFYDKKLAPEAVMIYFDALREYELGAVIAALREHVKTPGRCNFYPKPGNIEELIVGTKATAALRAWTKVERAIRTQGAYRSVVFDDAAVHLVIDEMGGWVRLCETGSEKDLEFQRNVFCKRYEATNKLDAYPAVMRGVLDSEALKHGRAPSPPVLIGNEELSRQVMQLGSVSTSGTPNRAMVAAGQETKALEQA